MSVTSLTTVRKAIEFGNPEYIPCYGLGNDPDNDVVSIPFVWRTLDHKPDKSYTTEWGFVVRPNTEGPGYHVDYSPLTNWDDYPKYRFPDIADAQKALQDTYAAMITKNPSVFKDKYVLGHEAGGPYLFMAMIRGHENFFMDLLVEKEKIGDLFDRVVDYFIGLFKKWKALGAHGVLCHEDWGSSHGLIMSPASWREIFLPRYKKMKKAANDMGMHFGIQVTGDVYEVLPDLIDMKLDFLFYPEMNAIGIKKFADVVRDKLCVFTAMDWKETAPLGTPVDVRREIQEIVKELSTPRGGLGFWLLRPPCKEENYNEQVRVYKQCRYRPKTGSALLNTN